MPNQLKTTRLWSSLRSPSKLSLAEGASDKQTITAKDVISAQEERLDIMNENQSKVDEYLSNINTLEARVKELEPRYKKSSKLFHSKKEVEDLYQNISNYAMTNGLSIINIKKGEPEPAGGAENSGENTDNKGPYGERINFLNNQ